MKLIYKLNAITFFSTIIVIILLVFSIRNSQKNSTVLHSIEKGYFPSLLVNKNLESQLLEMKRTFLDAGMAGDSDMLNKNEGLMDSIKTELNMLLSYKIVHPDTIKSLENNFNDYFKLSNSVVSDMISGNMGMDFGEKTVQMNQSYNQLENQIKQQYLRLNEKIEKAFSDSDKLIKVIMNFLYILTISILLTFVIGLIFSKKVIDVIIGIVERLKDIAQGEGDLTKTLEVNAKDETGDLAYWFNSFVEKIRNVVKSIAGEAGTLKDSTADMENVATTINGHAQKMNEKAGHTAHATEDLKTNMRNVSAAVEESNSNVNSVASSAEEMTVTISEILKNTEKAKSSTGNALSKVDISVENVNEFGKKANEIGKIIEAINEIADQTNLLSLNATIEAARAGEAGKGFAVVANEIKELAMQSNDAANNISNMIASIQTSITTTVTDIKLIEEVIKEVNAVVEEIAASIENQSLATREITDNISQMSSGLKDINGSVQKVYSFVDEVAEDTEESKKISNNVNQGINNITESSFQLKEMANRLGELVGRFSV